MKRMKTIMMIDDDEDDRFVFEKLFKELDSSVEVTSVENGKRAIELLNTGSHPDLILIDVNMHGMNGYECLATIRKCNTCCSVPVVMMSTSEPDPRQKGFSTFYTKPSETIALKKMLQEIINRVISKT